LPHSCAFQLCVKNKLLPKTLRATFDTHEQAEQYVDQLERLLAPASARRPRHHPADTRTGHTGNLDYDWTDASITSMTREASLAPSTIRHRHCSTRSRLRWIERGKSPTSSRNSVPLSTASNPPALPAAPPVRVPFRGRTIAFYPGVR
jgi:hypothetical protein